MTVGAALGAVAGLGALLIAGWFPRMGTSSGRVSGVPAMLREAHVDIPPARFIGLCVLAAVVSGLLTYGLTSVPAIAAVAALAAGFAPRLWVAGRRRRVLEDTRRRWPDLVDDMASGVRAGLGIGEALADLVDRAPAPLVPAFTAFAADMRTSGRLGDALANLKSDLADPVGDRVVEVLRTAREVGGSDVGLVLRTLAAFLREENRTRAELAARQSWTVNGARLAVASPWLVLLMLGTRPDAAAAYRQPTGVLVIAVGAAISALAYVAMLRLGRLPDEPRVLS